MTQIPFSSLPLPASLLQSLAQLGYENTTDIQASALPLILEGRDLIAQAPTGSGKTAAFGLGLLAPLNPRFFGCQSLVLSPTRELAAQITEELRKLARGMGNIKIVTLSGGVPFGPQAASLEQGAHVIVGTPGRVQDHLSRGTLQLDSLNCLVLDEADRMLDMGFVDAIREIVGHTPSRRQTLLFSATYPPSLAQLTGDLLRDPAQVKVERASADNPIEQRFYEIEPEQRFASVLRLLAANRPQPCIAFCHTRQQCQELADYLGAEGISAQALHGDMEQRERDQVLALFANQSCSVLTATDVAARGIDIAGVAAVINVELAADPAAHTHRIGRTGRAEESGKACTFVTHEDFPAIKDIERKLKMEIPRIKIRDFKRDPDSGGDTFKRQGRPQKKFFKKPGSGKRRSRSGGYSPRPESSSHSKLVRERSQSSRPAPAGPDFGAGLKGKVPRRQGTSKGSKGSGPSSRGRRQSGGGQNRGRSGR